MDRHKAISWRKYTSLKRCDWVLCHIVETLDRGNPELARAQAVQCMTCLHAFTDHGSWKASWPYTHMVDPLDRYTRGGLEAETEVVLGYLRTQDDIRSKVMRSTKDQVSEGEASASEGSELGPMPRRARRGRTRGRAPARAKTQALQGDLEAWSFWAGTAAVVQPQAAAVLIF